MTYLEMITADIDTMIDCEVDCIGCRATDCPYDKRINGEKVGDNNVTKNRNRM